MKNNIKSRVTHANTNPDVANISRMSTTISPDQLAAMDSCFSLAGPHHLSLVTLTLTLKHPPDMHPYICPTTHPARPSLDPCFHPSSHPSLPRFIYPFLHLSIHPPVARPSVRPTMHQSIHVNDAVTDTEL